MRKGLRAIIEIINRETGHRVVEVDHASRHFILILDSGQRLHYSRGSSLMEGRHWMFLVSKIRQFDRERLTT